MDALSGYDAVASAYVERFQEELGQKPFDARMLEWFAGRARSVGPLCDMGCGPGHVAAYLRSLRCDVCGVDLSSEMVRHAQGLNPGIPFEQGGSTCPRSLIRPTEASRRSIRS